MTTRQDAALDADTLWRCRCVACRLPVPLCVCAHIPLLPTLHQAPRLTFVVHHKEWKRLSNTARLMRLVYRCNQGLCDVVKHGEQSGPADGQALADDGATFVLFPGARVLTAEAIASLPARPRIIVPDGNWGQAKQIVKRVPALRRLPVYALPHLPQDINRMRRNIFNDRMSTFEAVAQAIGLFQGADVEEKLVDFLRRAADRMLLMRGRLKASDVHGGLTVGHRSRSDQTDCSRS